MNKERELASFYSRSPEVVTEPRLGPMEPKATLLLLPRLSKSLLESGGLDGLHDLWAQNPRWMIPIRLKEGESVAAAMREGALSGRPPSAPLSPLVRWLRYSESSPEATTRELDQWIAQYRGEVTRAKGVLCVAALESGETRNTESSGDQGHIHRPIPLVLADFSARDRFATLKTTLGALELRWLLERVALGAQNFSTLCSGMGSPIE